MVRGSGRCSTGIDLNQLQLDLEESSRWAPDRCSCIAQTSRPTLKVLDGNPGADQCIQAILQWLERGQCFHILGLWQRQVDGLNVLTQPIVNPPELLQQFPDPFFY